jgi:CheY-like chemotaxis protein
MDDFKPRKLFILEDNKERIRIFKRELGGHNLTIAESYDEAIEKWKGPYDVIFLDNDLGGQTMMSPEEYNSGYHFAKTMQKELSGKIVFVHSLNPVMRPRIAQLVTGNEAPFITINWDLVRDLLQNDHTFGAQDE